MSRGRVLAVIDLPHNTFRPYCNAKTCLLVLQKGKPARPHDSVIMAEAAEMGHNHRGEEIYRPGTDEVWDDLAVIGEELTDPDSEDNELVFTVPWSEVEERGHMVPRYYASRRTMSPAPPTGREWVVLGDLVDSGTVGAWDGHGSPSGAEKGAGNVPYIRVKDIVNWELYRDPTSGVTEATWARMTRNKRPVNAGDVIYVRRGSYRVGTVAMASDRDGQILMTRELLTLRVLDDANEITPYYLLALLSSRAVQDQTAALTFYDTTLPTIGDRWRELRLPVHVNARERQRMSERVRAVVELKWTAQNDLDALRSRIGEIVT